MSPGKCDSGQIQASRSPRPFSGREIGRPDVNTIGVQRPVPDCAKFAEFLLCQPRRRLLVVGVDLDGALTCLTDLSLVADDLLQKADDKVRHEILAVSTRSGL